MPREQIIDTSKIDFLRRANPIKRKVADLYPNGSIFQKQEEINARSCPMISYATSFQLDNEFNVAENPDHIEVASRYEGLTEDNPFFIALSKADELFSYLRNGNKKHLVSEIQNWLRKNYMRSSGSPVWMDSASAGMAVVLRAFQLQTHSSFLENLRNLDSFYLRPVFEDVIGYNPTMSKIDRAMTRTEIPPFQLYLNGSINRLAAYSPVEYALLDGAAVVYKVIDEFWPQINNGDFKKD